MFTSPLLVYGGHPKSLLDSPAVEMIKSIPSVWDETVVLPMSEIGQVAAVARRHGDEWFLAVLGGPDSRKLTVPLTFLDSSPYRAMLVRDGANDPTEIKIENVESTSADSLQLELREGGGFIGRFVPRTTPISAGVRRGIKRGELSRRWSPGVINAQIESRFWDAQTATIEPPL